MTLLGKVQAWEHLKIDIIRHMMHMHWIWDPKQCEMDHPIRQIMTVRTFDFLIWADAESWCGCNGDIHLKPPRGHIQIRQTVIVRTFDFLIWTYANFQCGYNGSIHFYQGNMSRLGKWWPWELLTFLYGQMQNFDVVLMVVFILPYMLLFLHNLHFIFKKPAMKIKIDTYNFLIGMYTPLWVCIHFL